MKPVNFKSIEIPGADGEATGVQDNEPVNGADFSQKLKDAVARVDELQLQTDTESQKLANGEGNLHETMLALEKADVAMKVALKVRNKILDAYNEVMRMPV